MQHFVAENFDTTSTKTCLAHVLVHQCERHVIGIDKRKRQTESCKNRQKIQLNSAKNLNVILKLSSF